jgi:luciferase family oxidoreductase group 1
MPLLSILDLAFVPEGGTPADALRNTRDLAQHAERWGYRRFWLAEHHNMVGIASAATAVVIGYVAANTRTIRVGAGGIMLPNHSPLVIAEQFGTLETLYPGRIDLGLGRAPGTDQRTLLALRRAPESAESFPDDVLELQEFFASPKPGQAVQAVSGRRSGGATLDSWIEFVRRAACRDSWAALCICFALCARRLDSGAAGISQPLQAIEAT